MHISTHMQLWDYGWIVNWMKISMKKNYEDMPYNAKDFVFNIIFSPPKHPHSWIAHVGSSFALIYIGI
jgi:hypothetical protein